MQIKVWKNLLVKVSKFIINPMLCSLNCSTKLNLFINISEGLWDAIILSVT